MTDANRELKRLVLRHKRRADLPLEPLTRKLLGTLDAAVQGGVANYERAFLTPAYERARPHHVESLNRLRELIAEQIPLLEAALDVHESRAPPALRALHDHLIARYRLARDHVHARYGRKVSVCVCDDTRATCYVPARVRVIDHARVRYRQSCDLDLDLELPEVNLRRSRLLHGGEDEEPMRRQQSVPEQNGSR